MIIRIYQGNKLHVFNNPQSIIINNDILYVIDEENKKYTLGMLKELVVLFDKENIGIVSAKNYEYIINEKPG